MQVPISHWVRQRPKLLAFLAAAAIVLLANLAAAALADALGYNRVSMIFLAGVLVAAVLLGSGPAYLAAVLGFFSYNFYLVEPRFSFGFESEDAIILAVFLAVAMLTGGLAGRVRDQARRAEAQSRTTTVLFQAGRDFAAMDDERRIGQRLAEGLAEAAEDLAAVRLGETLIPFPEAQDPELLNTVFAGGVEGWRVERLTADGRDVGLAAWRVGPAAGLGADEPRLIQVLLAMGASAIARARLARAWAEVQASERTESLRNALLSSISHDLRTPLASILASATSLREFGDRFHPDVREDLVLTIQEEAERLNAFVGNLLNMTRLEAGALELQASPVGIAEVFDRLQRRFEARRGSRRLVFRLEEDGLTASGDPILFEQALSNVIDNALRFSPEPAEVEVAGRRLDRLAIVEVADQGPGVPDDELARIFEKFYRSASTSGPQQGTGLGLSIVKGLIEAMGGVATARRRSPEGGLVVSLMLPREAE
ncbi:MAG: sensor histidine kinase [Pseudomonadota bacterium]